MARLVGSFKYFELSLVRCMEERKKERERERQCVPTMP